METMEQVRQYGGWRERKSFGLAGFTGPQTAVMGGLVFMVLVGGMFSPLLMFSGIPALLAVGGLMLARIHGEPLLDIATRHVLWRVAKRKGWRSYRAGQLPKHGGTAGEQLPGALAPVALVAAQDERNRPFGVLWNRRTGYLSAVIEVVSTSTWLVDTSQAEAFVANWSGWLAKLGYARTVLSVAVTVQTNPAPPETLEIQLQRKIDPNAPQMARQVLDDLVRNAPMASAQVRTMVTVTVNPAKATIRLNTLDEQIADFSRLLSGFEAGLGACGVTVLGRMSSDAVVRQIRAGFDPALLSSLEQASNLEWSDARPTALEEQWDQVRHDSGYSVSWAWDEAPRQAVTADVLARLMGPTRYHKRVTMLYTPTSAAAASRILDGEVQTTHFKRSIRRKQGRDESARAAADAERAKKAALEEARGAGLCDMQLFSTATVTNPDQLEAACADMENRSEESRIRMRRLYGGQMVGFLTTLGVGVDPNLLRKPR